MDRLHCFKNNSIFLKILQALPFQVFWISPEISDNIVVGKWKERREEKMLKIILETKDS